MFGSQENVDYADAVTAAGNRAWVQPEAATYAREKQFLR
jgi:hypothetical protein